METIEKVTPINKKNDNKKIFYQMKDNLMRFYFTYIFAKQFQINLLEPEVFYSQYIEPSIHTFISYRFEEIAKQYFSRQVKSSQITNVYDIGSYWYDDSQNHTNGEFDCVLKRKDAYDIYECKYYRNPMSFDECRKEIEQIQHIPSLTIGQIWCICSSGFQFQSDTLSLIDSAMLFES